MVFCFLLIILIAQAGVESVWAKHSKHNSRETKYKGRDYTMVLELYLNCRQLLQLQCYKNREIHTSGNMRKNSDIPWLPLKHCKNSAFSFSNQLNWIQKSLGCNEEPNFAFQVFRRRSECISSENLTIGTINRTIKNIIIPSLSFMVCHCPVNRMFLKR